MAHVRTLANLIGERHLGRPQALQATADYIRTVWAGHGLSVSEERFEAGGQSVVNLIVEQKGTQRPEDIVLIGAHYDSAPGTPGANDNGTGVALLLEMARALTDVPASRTIRYVAFVNEEPPYFFSEQNGKPRARPRGRPARRAHRCHGVPRNAGVLCERRQDAAVPVPVRAFSTRAPGTSSRSSGISGSRGTGRGISAALHGGEAPFRWRGLRPSSGSRVSTGPITGRSGRRATPPSCSTDTRAVPVPRVPPAPGTCPIGSRPPEFARAAHGIIQVVRKSCGRTGGSPMRYRTDVVEEGPLRRLWRFCVDQGTPAALAVALIAVQRFGYVTLLPLNVVIEREYGNYRHAPRGHCGLRDKRNVRAGTAGGFGIGPLLGTIIASLAAASPFMFRAIRMQFGLPPMQFAPDRNIRLSGILRDPRPAHRRLLVGHREGRPQLRSNILTTDFRSAAPRLQA